jgi:hypothetical protein
MRERKDTVPALIARTNDIDKLKQLVALLSEKNADEGYIRTVLMKIYYLETLSTDSDNTDAR